MKKKLLRAIAVTTAAAALLAGCGSANTTPSNNNSSGSSASSEATAPTETIDPITLSSTCGFAAGHAFQRGGMDPVLEAITEKTGGAVTWDSYIGGELMAMGTELDGVLTDQVDLGWSNSMQFDPARYPLSSALYLPVLGADMKLVMDAYKEIFEGDTIIGDSGKTFYQYEFDDKGLVAFLGTTVAEQAIITTGHELQNPEDFSTDLRVRSGSRAWTIMLTNAGLTPLAIQLGEVADAMNRGMIDGVFISPNWVDYGLDELTTYCLRGFTANSLSAPIMKKDKFESLPESVQTAIKEAFDENYYPFLDFIKEEDKAQFKALEDRGCKIVTLDDISEGAREKLDAAMIQTWYDWIDETEAAGHPGKAMAKLWADTLSAHGVELPEELLNLDSYGA